VSKASGGKGGQGECRCVGDWDRWVNCFLAKGKGKEKDTAGSKGLAKGKGKEKDTAGSKGEAGGSKCWFTLCDEMATYCYNRGERHEDGDGKDGG